MTIRDPSGFVLRTMEIETEMPIVDTVNIVAAIRKTVGPERVKKDQ